VQDLHASPIREILSVIDRPDMVSFAGGLPSEEAIPAFDVSEVPRRCLQYGPTEGEPALRSRVAEELGRQGLTCDPSQVLVLSGSQQGIDLIAKLFIDAGAPVAVESPTYLAALQAFRFFGARFMTMDLRDSAVNLRGAGQPTFAYVVPTFQNPTGRCYTADERDALAQWCDRLNVPLFEDDPYRDLAYEACDRLPVCASVRSAPWVYQGSFSKTLAPGLRLGFLVASPELVPYLTRLKQAADLHSNRLSQWLVLNHLNDERRAAQLADTVEMYRRKRDRFAECLERHFSDIATWQRPAGGLFFWVKLNRLLDTAALLPQAIARGVAFMPGDFFYADAAVPRGTLRLNFSHASEEKMDRGLAILADLIKSAPSTAP
jgi:DNA-binding transcriptional MocR family regulator